MALMLKTQRDGRLREWWYGVYTESDGARKVVNLAVKWKGTPPESGRVGDAGDDAFEKSRERAEDALTRFVDKSRVKGRVEHLTERLIASKTGRAVEYVRIDELPERWRNLGRETPATEAHLGNCDAHFRRFIAFMKSRNPKSRFLYEVTTDDATAFVKFLRASLAPATAQYGVRLMRKAAARFLPVGAENPFSSFVGGRRGVSAGVVHRLPFTPEELGELLDTARADPFMYPLVVTAACTGMRRGDVCRLRHRDVDLAGGMLNVSTSKTEEAVEIPIFPPLREVLEGIPRKGQYVFPAAEAMLRDNPGGLTRRFKNLVAASMGDGAADARPEPVAATDVALEGKQAITEHIGEGERRDRMMDTLRRYCEGESVREIQKATGRTRSTISTDLHAVESMIGKTFMRRTPGRHTGSNLESAVARTTRAPRPNGQKSASVRDWHALRTTWVTIALTAGVPVELVKRVTGHKTVEVVMTYYFRPDREQFRAALSEAMPGVLSGAKPTTKRLRPADELAMLAGKVAAGEASEKEKNRLRILAAKV